MTKITRIHGDIWKFHDKLKQFLIPFAYDEHIGSQVDEVGRKIRFKGDLTEATKKFLIKQGF